MNKVIKGIAIWGAALAATPFVLLGGLKLFLLFMQYSMWAANIFFDTSKWDNGGGEMFGIMSSLIALMVLLLAAMWFMPDNEE